MLVCRVDRCATLNAGKGQPASRGQGGTLELLPRSGRGHAAAGMWKQGAGRQGHQRSGVLRADAAPQAVAAAHGDDAGDGFAAGAGGAVEPQRQQQQPFTKRLQTCAWDSALNVMVLGMTKIQTHQQLVGITSNLRNTLHKVLGSCSLATTCEGAAVQREERDAAGGAERIAQLQHMRRTTLCQRITIVAQDRRQRLPCFLKRHLEGPSEKSPIYGNHSRS